MVLHEKVFQSAEVDFKFEIERLILLMRSRYSVDSRYRVLHNHAFKIRSAALMLNYQRFKRFWILYRLSVNLQVRLFVEAVMFSMGKPWSDLVSGFKPLVIDDIHRHF